MDTIQTMLDQKLELIQWITTIEDASIIEKVMDLRNKESKDWWDSISNSEKESIELGLKDAKEGKHNAHSIARGRYEKWL